MVKTNLNIEEKRELILDKINDGIKLTEAENAFTTIMFMVLRMRIQ